MKRIFPYLIFLSFVFGILMPSAEAEVRLPEFFGSDMVLQRDTDIPVWGWASSGEKIVVTLENKSETTVADDEGRWSLLLPPHPAGGPCRLIVEGGNRLVLENVLLGDVWLCSGQSNMDWKMEQFPDSKAEIPSIDKPRIRLFRVARALSSTPQDRLSTAWTPCNPQTVASFSAVAYYFGNELNERLDVPIGLVNASWGGTRIEPWTPEAGFRSNPAFRLGEVSDRGMLDTLVPEAGNFRLLYRFDPTSPVMKDGNHRFEYDVDRGKEISGRVKRVGYFLWLKPKNKDEQFVFVTMPPLSEDLAKLGVPTKASGARFQEKVRNVTVRSNVPGIPTGTFAEGCNVEFWDCSYDTANGIGIPDASESSYDFGDKIRTSASPGFGSMQIHQHETRQTIFAFNAFAKGRSCDIGIGNCSGKNPDWTHSKSGVNYESGLFLILVETEETE